MATLFQSTECRAGKAVDPALVDVVLYHGKCLDGFGAAYAVWCARGAAARYIPRDHTVEHKAADDIWGELVGKHVLIVDYCFPLATTRRIMEVAASVLVLDHHASAQKDMEDLPDANKVFCMKQSGATLAHNFMRGMDVEVPLFLRYIEDADLWTKRLPSIEAFRTAVATLPFDFETWHRYASTDMGVADIIALGTPLVAFRDDRVLAAVRAAAPATLTGFPGVRAKVVNERNWVSEVGSGIVNAGDGTDVALMWFAEYGNGLTTYNVSLRSKEGSVDVSAIARALGGGGGHKAAAGFKSGTTPEGTAFSLLAPT